jgi:uncharacterized protein involved in cysteine biosynthesis
MARTIRIFTISIILLWSLLSLGVWAALSLGGDFMYSQLDWIFGGNPDVVPAAGSVFRFFQNLGLGLVFVVWALGSLTVWIAGTILRRLAESVSVVHVRDAGWVDAYEGERPMKDVTPPRATRSLPPN